MQLVIKENSVVSEAVILPITEKEITVIFEANAQADLFLFVTPGQTIKQNITIQYQGDGSGGNVLGLVIGKNKDTYEGSLRIEHIGQNTTTNVLIKGVLFDQSFVKVEGLLRVEPGAKKTNTYYRSDFLLLSREARVVTIPSLEIIENDLLGGGHAATVSSLDPEQLFYTQSRAIGTDEARQLLVSGFASAVLNQLQESKQREDYLKRIEQEIL